MNNRKKISARFAAAVLAMTMSAAMSAGAADSTLTDTPDTTAPSVAVISGGVGDSAMDQVKEIQGQYNLKLLFTENNGEYLANVPVQIHDSHGRLMVDATADGPVMLVALPPGTYNITATEAGETKDHKVTLRPQSRNEFQFRFDTHDSETSELETETK